MAERSAFAKLLTIEIESHSQMDLMEMELLLLSMVLRLSRFFVDITWDLSKRWSSIYWAQNSSAISQPERLRGILPLFITSHKRWVNDSRMSQDFKWSWKNIFSAIFISLTLIHTRVVFKNKMPFDWPQDIRSFSAESVACWEIDKDRQSEVSFEQEQENREEQVYELVFRVDEHDVDDGDANVEQEENQIESDSCDGKLTVFGGF